MVKKYELSSMKLRTYCKGDVVNKSGYDVALVQRLLQHSSAATTQRYIGIELQRIEKTIENHVQLL